MSKRLSTENALKSIILRLAIACFSAISFFWCSTLSAKSTVSLEQTEFAIQGTFQYIDLSLTQDELGPQLGGIDLSIKFNDQSLQFISATPGALLTSCGWEYFSATLQGDVIHIVALANDPQVSGEPDCFLTGANGDLAVLKFLVTFNAMECEDIPLRFYWADCGDNAFSSIGGDSLFGADTVFWGSGVGDYYAVPASLGTSEGLPESCVEAAHGTLTRHCSFVEGMIGTACPDTVSYRGDLNLNGIPWEVADFEVFANYFFFGLSAFNPNALLMQAQIAASDCNNDGLTLQPGDISFLKRVIVGNTSPKQPSRPDATALFVNNSALHTVSLTTSEPLCLIFLTFSGLIVPQAASGSESIMYAHSTSGNTFAMIWESASPSVGYDDGPLITYTGSGHLIAAAATDWTDQSAATSIEIQTLSSCGDVDGSATLNISDCVYLIRYIFAGGIAPVDEHGGDVNCDGVTSISDAVYLLTHIFAGGPAPCFGCE